MNKLVLCSLFALSAISPTLFAQTTAADAAALAEQREQARIDRMWALSWRDYAKSYIEHGEEFVCVPGYDPRYPSSTGKTLSHYQQVSAWQQQYKDEIGRDKSRKLTKPTGDAFAAVSMLPEVKAGAYGYIHSGHIMEIIDRRTMVLEDIWLIDEGKVREEKAVLMSKALEQANDDIDAVINDKRDRRKYRDDAERRRDAERKAVNWMFEERAEAVDRQRSRAMSRYQWELIGYRTVSLTEDARWPSGKAAEQGLQVVILEVKGSKVTAAPASALAKGLTEDQFASMLHKRGLTKADFVNLVTDIRREETNKEKAIAIGLARIEGLETPAEQGPADRGNVNDTVELAD